MLTNWNPIHRKINSITGVSNNTHFWSSQKTPNIKFVYFLCMKCVSFFFLLSQIVDNIIKRDIRVRRPYQFDAVKLKKKSIYVHLFQLFYTASVRVLRTGLKGLIHNSEAANSCIPHLGINKMKLENKRKKRRWNKRGFFSRPSRLYSVGTHKKRFEKNIL